MRGEFCSLSLRYVVFSVSSVTSYTFSDASLEATELRLCCKERTWEGVPSLSRVGEVHELARPCSDEW